MIRQLRRRRRGLGLLDEITALTDANRARRNPKTERRLVRRRIDALDALEPGNGPSTWPPEVPDLFPDAVGFPEIPRAQLTADALRSGIFHHGGLIVRGLLDPSTADTFVENIDQAIASQEAAHAGTSTHDRDPDFVPLEQPDDPGLQVARGFAYENVSVLAVDAPRVLFDLFETFRETGIEKLTNEFFGERPTLLAKKCVLRRVPPDLGLADWHQDGAFMGADIRSLNVWIALSHCGDDAPGMDIVARRFEKIVETGTHGAMFEWSVGHAVAEQVADGAIVRPQFAPGDALLFDHFLLHRTDTHPGMTRSRYAIETWFAAGSSYPENQTPIVY